MISTLLILTPSGEIIVEKQFKEKLPRTVLEDFWRTYVFAAPSIEEVPSIIQYSRYAFFHIVRKSIVYMAVANQEVPPMMVLEQLNHVANMLQSYIKEETEDALRENFSLVYQLLEEMLDYGFPLTTELGALEELVPPQTLENKVRRMLDVPQRAKKAQDFNAVPWREMGIKYVSNEIFFDVFESLDVLADAEGNIIRACVNGEIHVQCHLSGMPDVLLHIHNAEIFDDVSYNRCVRHNRYEADRTIAFIPPDGKFTLFRYRCKPFHTLQAPFYVTPQVSFSKDGGRVNVIVGLRHGGVRETGDKEHEVFKLAVTIPLPPQTESIAVGNCSHGTYSFDSSAKLLHWRIGQLGSSTPSLTAEFAFGRNSTADLIEGSGECVLVEFQIPNWAISGIRVDTVTVVNEPYKPYKGVKYITRAGRYAIRTV